MSSRSTRSNVRIRAAGLLASLGALTGVALAGASQIFGCTVDSLDLTGKQCPCVGAFVCDVATNTCVVPGPETEGGPAPADAGVPGKITVTKLRPSWTTANGVRWEWEAQGEESDFRAYEVVVGPTAEAVRARASSTRVFGARDNPELGVLAGRDRGDTERPLELSTVTDGHRESETVFAQVFAIDQAGGVSATDVASAQTLRPRGSLVLFDNGIAAGGEAMPDSGAVTASAAYGDGGVGLAFTVSCGDAGPTCIVEVGVDGYTGKSLSALDGTDFDRAFLEIAVRGGRVPDTYTDVVLSVGPASCGAACKNRHGGWSLAERPDEFRLLQVPLRVLRRNDGTGGSLNYQELKNRSFRVHGFHFGGRWPSGAALALDQCRIRW